MNALRGRTTRDLDFRWQTTDLRSEWYGHALSTAPADRQASEAAITGLYALAGEPPPAFVWVRSPAAAQPLLPPSAPLSVDGPWPLESRLASVLSSLRERLDRKTGAHREPYPPARPTPLEAAVRDPVHRVAHESVAAAIRSAIPTRSGVCWYGQHEAAWVAHYDAHHRFGPARFEAADVAQLQLWTTLARSCGWWWPRDGRCVIAERPTTVHTEPVAGSEHGETRLHSARGPAVVFPDGWAIHSWHGTTVPAWVVDTPTVDLIGAEPNVEVRRCAIENLGWARFIAEAGLTLVGRAQDPGNPGGELSLYDLPYEQWGRTSRLLLAVNGSLERDGTRRRYGLRVPPWFDDPIDAAAWTYGLVGSQYALLRRRT
ncbi:DUF6745 domain-containing protein [Umezawaea sp. Da 62-37]|uniref:DUF6745 domain-containing protein n=1 Tax=Umezawaea sp. Da 62-37 TaxID=3075927 RepID=UPI0028F7444A|nr:hypothetical protein [Umezawaea sp. Da 62-37]WNV87261.1 hypothetical protein RM788_02890 [Umezawaea sp. Da 62-37]